MIQVFEATISLKESRPQIDFALPQDKKNDWALLDEIIRGEQPGERYTPVKVIAQFEDVAAWDFYAVPGTFGLFSQRAIGAIPKGALNTFDVLEARINMLKYYILRPLKRILCLNLRKSQVTRFPSNPNRIMSVEKFVFLSDAITDPLVFCPTEINALLMTGSVVESIQQAGCNGLDCTLVGTV